MAASHARRLAPVAVAVAVLLLGACTDSIPSGGATGARPSPASETLTPTSKPTEPTEPARPDEVIALPIGDGGTYVSAEAGRYTGPMSASLRYEVDIPKSVHVFEGAYVNLRDDGLHFVSQAAKQTTALPTHPCRDRAWTAVGPTVHDLAEALYRQPFLEVSKPVPAVVGGAKGLFLTVKNPLFVNTLECPRAFLYSGGGTAKDSWGAGAGYVGRFWIVTVNGQRFVIHAECPTGCTRHETDVLTGMVESMTFAAR